jgi:hypothetical protein
MCNKSEEWWAREFEKLEAYESRPSRGKTPSKPPKPAEEELMIKCDACGLTEPITLTDGFIDSRIKYIQDGLNFEVAHMCREGHYGTVRLLNGISLGQYIRRKKAKEDK